MYKKYFYLIIACILCSFLFSRSMEFTSAKTYARVERNFEKAEEFGVLALEIEPDNSYVPFFLAKEVYRPQKKRIKAGRMFVEALNRPDIELRKEGGQSFRRGDDWIYTVHEATVLFGSDWYNYGIDAMEKKNYDDAIEHFDIASKLDPSLTSNCYINVADIYFYDKQDPAKAIEYLDIALGNIDDQNLITTLNIRKASYYRKNKEPQKALEILSSLPEENLSLNAKEELFFVHMDNDDCESATSLGESLFIAMEDDPDYPMSKISGLAYNIALCYKLKADLLYNDVIDYLASEDKTNDQTNSALEKCDSSKRYYKSAKNYFRSSLDYEEEPSEVAKAYKKEMRAMARKIDDMIIPPLENLLK